MAFDPGLAQRVREMLSERDDVVERKMFGGLAFLIDGKMAVGISGSELMARVGPDRYPAALAEPHVRKMDFTGRPMTGYVFVGPEGLADDQALESWISHCVGYVAGLPPKKLK